jgi:hypothetical protein
MLGGIIKVITNLHVVTIAAKAVGRVIKMVAHSNFGLIGLDRLASWLGIG